jgi:hypothetical protein
MSVEASGAATQRAPPASRHVRCGDAAGSSSIATRQVRRRSRLLRHRDTAGAATQPAPPASRHVRCGDAAGSSGIATRQVRRRTWFLRHRDTSTAATQPAPPARRTETGHDELCHDNDRPATPERRRRPRAQDLQARRWLPAAPAGPVCASHPRSAGQGLRAPVLGLEGNRTRWPGRLMGGPSTGGRRTAGPPAWRCVRRKRPCSPPRSATRGVAFEPPC